MGPDVEPDSRGSRVESEIDAGGGHAQASLIQKYPIVSKAIAFKQAYIPSETFDVAYGSCDS